MKRSIKWRTQKGVTLVEVMVGTMVFFIAILAIFYALPSLNRNTREATQRTLASLSARSMIEELKGRSNSLISGQFPFTPLEGTHARLALYEVRQEERVTQISVIIVWGQFEGQKIVLSTLVRKS